MSGPILALCGIFACFPRPVKIADVFKGVMLIEYVFDPGMQASGCGVPRGPSSPGTWPTSGSHGLGIDSGVVPRASS